MTRKELIKIVEELKKEKRTIFMILSPSGIMDEDDPMNQGFIVTYDGKIYSPFDVIKNAFEADPSFKDDLCRLFIKVLIAQFGGRLEAEIIKQKSGIN